MSQALGCSLIYVPGSQPLRAAESAASELLAAGLCSLALSVNSSKELLSRGKMCKRSQTSPALSNWLTGNFGWLALLSQEGEGAIRCNCKQCLLGGTSCMVGASCHLAPAASRVGWGRVGWDRVGWGGAGKARSREATGVT